MPQLPPARHGVVRDTQERFALLDATWKDLDSRVENNLNQLAHVANETRQLPSYERLTAAWRALEELRGAMIEAVGGAPRRRADR